MPCARVAIKRQLSHCDIMGIPVLALRDEQGDIQILLNVCSHRAAPLLTERKGTLSKPLLMCQYHGWCYHTDGSFKHAPFVTEHCESLNLRRISYREARGMIFITFNPEPYSFDSRIAAFFRKWMRRSSRLKIIITTARLSAKVISTGKCGRKDFRNVITAQRFILSSTRIFS